MDWEEPLCLEKIESTTIAPIARNSLCQFWNDSNQKREVLERRHGLPAVLRLLLAVGAGVPDGVRGEREHEQGEEHYAQRVLVELQNRTPAPNRPRGIFGIRSFAVARVVRVLALRVL